MQFSSSPLAMQECQQGSRPKLEQQKEKLPAVAVPSAAMAACFSSSMSSVIAGASCTSPNSLLLALLTCLLRSSIVPLLKVCLSHWHDDAWHNRHWWLLCRQIHQQQQPSADCFAQLSGRSTNKTVQVALKYLESQHKTIELRLETLI